MDITAKQEEWLQAIAAASDGPAAAELEAAYSSIKTTDKLPDAAAGSSTADIPPTHVLLYLNDNTYLGESGHRLAQILRKARTTELPIVMAHENDAAKGGCAAQVRSPCTPPTLHTR